MKFSKKDITKIHKANETYCGSLVEFRRTKEHLFVHGLIVKIYPSIGKYDDEILMDFYRISDNELEKEWTLHGHEITNLINIGILGSIDIKFLAPPKENLND